MLDGTAPGLGGAMGTVLMTCLCWLGAMLMVGLLTAHSRVSGLHANGLIDQEALGPVLGQYIQHQRRFQVTVGTVYLSLTLLGAFGWGHMLMRLWSGPLDLKFHLLFAVTAVLAWSLGGLVFKMLAAGTVLGYAKFVGTLIYPLNWLLRPWASLMLAVMDRLDDTLWITDAQQHLSAGEIRRLMAEDTDHSTLDEDEREMIQSIFNFHDTAVREIMVPRIDMVALDVDAETKSVLETVIAEGHSRVPVYQGNIDKVIGILYSKDLLKIVNEGGLESGGRVLSDLVRSAYFIPESKKIDEVLDEFRAKRIHMAVVVDEYGGTAGLVTLEDVLEEIVGEIEDEFDEEETLVTWVDETAVRLDPKIDLEDLEEVLGVAFDSAEGAETSETLGGLIYEAAGNVPERGDKMEVAGFAVTVEDVADQRILRVFMKAEQPLPGFAKRNES